MICFRGKSHLCYIYPPSGEISSPKFIEHFEYELQIFPSNNDWELPYVGIHLNYYNIQTWLNEIKCC